MTTINLDKISIVHWYYDAEKHKCGYCKNERGSISDGMWAEQLTVEDYQNLVDRGWRRSGKYCYKPIMHETCCPLYTIRCEALKFHPSKSQKKIIKRFNKFIVDGVRHKEENLPSKSNDNGPNESVSSELISRPKPSFEIDFSRFKDNVIPQQITEGRFTNTDVRIESDSHDTVIEDESVKKTLEQSTSTSVEICESEEKHSGKTGVRKGTGADPNKPPCKKAKLLRLERKQQKLLQKGLSLEKTATQNEPKSLEQFIEEIPENPKLKLKIVLISTSCPGEDWEKSKKVEYELYRKYQMGIHNDPPEKCTMHGFLRFLVNTPLKIQMEKMYRAHPLFKEEAKLFEKYQMAIHDDKPNECDERQFYEFLVDTPLLNVRCRASGSAVTYGSFHQQYWIDDKLVAVGVIDILPKCISSVYFFYDPDYRFLTLGTYGSLREIYFVRSLHQIMPTIEYYYMGFYIHTCPKMRYKGRLSNSFLLCPETYEWFPLEQCIPKLEISKYSRLNDDANAVDKDKCSPADIDRIKILVAYSFLPFETYKHIFGEEEVFRKISELIGKKCANKLLFVSSKE